MASEFLDRAVDAVADLLDSTLAAKLRLVETANGLNSGDLTDPIAIVRGQIPNDNRSPLVQVYEEDWGPVEQRNELWRVGISVIVTYTSSVDLVSGRLFMRRYMAAIKRVFISDPTASGQAVSIVITDGASAAGIGDRSESRLMYLQGLDVDVHDA